MQKQLQLRDKITMTRLSKTARKKMILLRHYQSQDVLLSLMPVGDISRGGNNLSGSRHQGFKTDMQS